MRAYSQIWKKASGWLLALASVAVAGSRSAARGEDQPAPASHAQVMVVGGGSGPGSAKVDAESGGNAAVISSAEPTDAEDPPARQDRPWLGVSVEEGSEALAAQLGLPPGSGLVIIYVAPDSPAAKAGLEKNDVLVELDSQLLVVPAQLRKLVLARHEGDKIKLVYYHAGKKETASVTLGKAPPGFGLFGDAHLWDGEVSPFLAPFAPGAAGERLRELRDALGPMKQDLTKAGEELQRSMEQARKAWHEAMRFSSNAISDSVGETLRELERLGIAADDNASVTVRSTGHRAKSIVKADESGTIVLVCNPKPHLTAHDKDGKLLFDGEIATPEQRASVPPELWEKVEPLLDKLNPKAEEDPEMNPAPPKEAPSLRRLPPSPIRPSAPGTV